MIRFFFLILCIFQPETLKLEILKSNHFLRFENKHFDTKTNILGASALELSWVLESLQIEQNHA